MFPFFEPFSWLVIYTFWLTITICFFMFIWMLKKLCLRYSSDFNFFYKNIIWYFISIFIFSRLFYVISRWDDMKYMNSLLDFFITSDYNFSIVWAIIWFFVIFIIKLKTEKKKLIKLIDPLVLSFLFILFIWYIWAFLWWQVYWRETFFWIEILYNNAFSPVPFQVPIFPLPIVYSILFFILFSSLYMLSMFVKIRWLIWYIWLISFSSILLIFEFFSWKYDIFKNNIWINMVQLFAIVLIITTWYNMYKLLQNPKIMNKTILK